VNGLWGAIRESLRWSKLWLLNTPCFSPVPALFSLFCCSHAQLGWITAKRLPVLLGEEGRGGRRSPCCGGLGCRGTTCLRSSFSVAVGGCKSLLLSEGMLLPPSRPCVLLLLWAGTDAQLAWVRAGLDLAESYLGRQKVCAGWARAEGHTLPCCWACAAWEWPWERGLTSASDPPLLVVISRQCHSPLPKAHHCQSLVRSLSAWLPELAQSAARENAQLLLCGSAAERRTLHFFGLVLRVPSGHFSGGFSILNLWDKSGWGSDSVYWLYKDWECIRACLIKGCSLAETYCNLF